MNRERADVETSAKIMEAYAAWLRRPQVSCDVAFEATKRLPAEMLATLKEKELRQIVETALHVAAEFIGGGAATLRKSLEGASV